MKRPSIPFFEVGPKTYLDRKQLLQLAIMAQQVSIESSVSIIFTAPALDVEAVKQAAPRLWVFSQTVDDEQPGNSTGAILPEALRAVGADGVILNHVERPTPAEALPRLIGRCREAGLISLVCAEDTDAAARIADLHPDMILAEPSELIGTANSAPRPWISALNNAVHAVDSSILVMHAGGISSVEDVSAVIHAGAVGTGATSAIVEATNPERALRNLVLATRKAWNEVHPDLVQPVASRHTPTDERTAK